MNSDRYPLKIITLWSTFLLGTLFHTQLGLMPFRIDGDFILNRSIAECRLLSMAEGIRST
jgi:hypothetical protein